jgi:uncharacterized protein YbaR (Trm112 family)
MTSVSPWVRQILRCPACHGPLDDADPSPTDGSDPPRTLPPPPALTCPRCRVVYPGRDGIVCLLIDQAVPL